MRAALLGAFLIAIPQDQDITPRNIKVNDFPDNTSADAGKLVVEWDVLPQETEAINIKIAQDLLGLKRKLFKLLNSDTKEIDDQANKLHARMQGTLVKYGVSCSLSKDGPYLPLASVGSTSSFKRDHKAPFWAWDKDISKHFAILKLLPDGPLQSDWPKYDSSVEDWEKAFAALKTRTKFWPDISLNFRAFEEAVGELRTKYKHLKSDSELKAEIEHEIENLSEQLKDETVRGKIEQKKGELDGRIHKVQKEIDGLRQGMKNNAKSLVGRIIATIDREIANAESSDLNTLNARRKFVREIAVKIEDIDQDTKKLLKLITDLEQKEGEKGQIEKDEEERKAKNLVRKSMLEGMLRAATNERRIFGEFLSRRLKDLDETEIETTIKRAIEAGRPEEKDALQVRLNIHNMLKSAGHYRSINTEVETIKTLFKNGDVINALNTTYNTNKALAVKQIDSQMSSVESSMNRLKEKIDDVNTYVSAQVVFVKLSASKGPVKKEAEVVTGSAKSNMFNWNKLNTFIFAVLFTVLILWLISIAKKKGLFLRKISGIDAIDDAIGRGVEMGRPMYFLTGRGDVVDIQHPQVAISTMAAIIVLGEVAKKVAQFEAKLKVPHTSPMVNVICQEMTKEAYVSVGKPDSYREDINFYITSDQFAYTAAVDGMMIREKPSACFYFGYYYAESLLLAETGAAQGAIQIAATDAEHQLPFFVAASDYALVGEELYAASAYISKDPVSTATLRGQDSGKGFIMLLILLFTLILTFVTLGRAEDGILNLVDIIKMY